MPSGIFGLKDQGALIKSLYFFLREDPMPQNFKSESTHLISAIAVKVAYEMGEQVSRMSENSYERAVTECESRWQKIPDNERSGLEDENDQYVEMRFQYIKKMADHVRECFQNKTCSIQPLGLNFKRVAGWFVESSEEKGEAVPHFTKY